MPHPSDARGGVRGKDYLVVRSAATTLGVTAGGDGLESDEETVAARGYVLVQGGTVNVVAGGDALHGATDALIAGGTLAVDAADDGLHANARLVVNGGTTTIASNDDGMHGGGVAVNGPTSSGNAAIDYDGTFQMTAGFLVGIGSSGMAQAPGTTSTQPALLMTFAARAAGTMIHLQNASGESLLDFVPTESYSAITFSSPKLTTGVTYSLYLGGSATGSVADGLYTGGTYTAGTLARSFTTTSTVTRVTF